MITTYEADKAPMFSMEPGFSTWRTATLNPGIPYVFVNFGLKDGRSWVYQTSILWDSRDVIDFCHRLKINKSAKIVGIWLLHPFRRDEKQPWQWARVREVRSYEDDRVEHPVYITDLGEAVGLIPQKSKPKMKLICKAPCNIA
jgi:hypothetical protein